MRKIIKLITTPFMNTNLNRMQRNIGTTFGIVILLTVLLSNPLRAQTAPPFSNRIMIDNQTYVYLIAERLEYTSVNGADPMAWDVQGYVGKDLNKFWFQTEGHALTSQTEGEMEFQGLYSRAISAYVDAQAGFRYSHMYSANGYDSREFAVLGLQGLAPYFFEFESDLYVSTKGDISARVLGSYNLLFTQRLIGQPRFETNLAVQEVDKYGIGSGFNNIKIGFRLRYEIHREFAPYIGISWDRKLGQTADFIQQEGGDAGTFGLVGGLRLWM